jgi:site-specific DNA-methyltransferase (adenine-specific)
MWDCIHQLSKERTPILLFGQEPFSSHLRLSNIKEYRYDWVWDRVVGTGFLTANKKPMNVTEQILVFYKKLPYYHPIMRDVPKKYDKPVNKGKPTSKIYFDNKGNRDLYVDDGKRYPLNLIKFNSKKKEVSHNKRLHPTQKPVELLEYLIKTYTNPKDLVLDFTMGSGSTGVACRNTDRRFIGIELDENYYKIAKKRII